MKRLSTLYLVLVCLTVLAYAPAIAGGYIWDDDGYVQYNSTLRSLAGLGRIWTEFGATQDYYPLTFTTFWLEYHVWGLAPAGYHLNNILLHGCNAILLGQLLARLRVPGFLFAAALFALHPVHVESVAWITERKNVLSGLFFLLALHAYIGFENFDQRQLTRSRRWLYYAASLGFFSLGMLSKTVTVTLPLVLPVFVWWQRGRLTRRDFAATVPYFVLAIPVFYLASQSGANFGGAGVPITGSTDELWNYSLPERFIIAGRCLWFYAGKLVYPVELSFVYPRWEIDGSIWWQYLFPITAFCVPLVFCLRTSRWGRGPAAAVLYFGLTLAPAVGFFNFYFQRYSFVADHLQYLASAGLISGMVAIVATTSQRFDHQLRSFVRAIGAVVLVLLGILTFQQSFIYTDLETLWRDTIKKNPNCEMAHTNLGLLLQEENRLDEAIGEFRQARDLAPQVAIVYNNLGMVLMQRGELSDALEQFERALSIDPAYAECRSNLGVACGVLGRHDEAMQHLVKAVELDAQAPGAQFNLAATLHERDRLDEAIVHYQAAIKSDPLHVRAHYNLGLIFQSQGRAAEAAGMFEDVARLQAEYP